MVGKLGGANGSNTEWERYVADSTSSPARRWRMAVRVLTPSFIFFFFQAEDGIRDLTVTGVQTCALPISGRPGSRTSGATPPVARDSPCGCVGGPPASAVETPSVGGGSIPVWRSSPRPPDRKSVV